jgi:hypothetical protein
MYKKGWMRGDVIHFYYIPKDHRTQYIKPSRGDFIELIPKSEFEQLQQENEELKDFAIWMTGCGYDFTSLDHFNKMRDKLLLTFNPKEGE